MQDCWLLCCLNTQIKPLSIFTCNLQTCVCACVCVCVCFQVHAGTLLYRSITWASDCAISPVSPLCSPRRLILPGGMVLMWESRGRGGGGWLHTLSVWEQLKPHGRSLSISSLLTSTSSIWSQWSHVSLVHWSVAIVITVELQQLID